MSAQTRGPRDRDRRSSPKGRLGDDDAATVTNQSVAPAVRADPAVEVVQTEPDASPPADPAPAPPAYAAPAAARPRPVLPAEGGRRVEAATAVHAPQSPAAPAEHRLPRLDDPDESAHAGRSRPWLWVIGLLMLAAVGVGGYFLYQRTHADQAAGPGGGKGKGGGPVPVVTATAREGNLPLYLNGLGTVTPLNTVTVRTRVDGQIDAIHFTEGQEVKAGELLAQIDPRPFTVQLEQAQGQLARDQATLENARNELRRDEQAKEAIAAQVLEASQAAVAQAEGVVKSDQAAMHSAELQLTYARVTSPVTGRVGLRYVDAGNIVHATDTTGLCVIDQLKPITVVFPLPQDAVDRVRSAMATAAAAGTKLDVEAWDRDLKHKLTTGALTAIDNQVDQTTGTFRLKAEFPNADEALFPNQFVNARLLVETRKNAVLAPTAAVQRGPDSTFVYVVKDDAVQLRPVTVGPTEGDVAAIDKGLAPGEVVVTDGVDKLTPGAKVVARKPTTRPGGGRSGETTQPAGAAGAAAHGAAGRGGREGDAGAADRPGHSAATTAPAQASDHTPAAAGTTQPAAAPAAAPQGGGPQTRGAEGGAR